MTVVLVYCHSLPQTLLSRFLFTYQIFERANLDWELGVIILQEYLHKQTQNVTMQVAR